MELGLGTVQFGLPYGISNQTGQVPYKELQKILEFAKKTEIQILDTAMAYGESESILGQVGVSEFKVITKLAPIPNNQKNISHWIYDSVSSSLEKLKINSLHGLLLHRCENLLGELGEQVYSAVQELKNSQKILKFGVSIYSPYELESIPHTYQLDIVQSPLNVIDRSLLTSGWLKKLKSKNTEIHVRSVFLQGLLLMSEETRPLKFQRWNYLWNLWHSWLEQSKINPLEACLGFIKSIEGIDTVIVGVESYFQLKEIHSAFLSKKQYSIPRDLESTDPFLINPSLWSKI